MEPRLKDLGPIARRLVKDGYCVVLDCDNASAPGSLYCTDSESPCKSAPSED